MHRHDLVFLSSEQSFTILDCPEPQIVSYLEQMRQAHIPFTVCRQNLPSILKLSTSCMINGLKYRVALMTKDNTHHIESPITLSVLTSAAVPILPESIIEELNCFINICEALEANVYVYGSFSNQYLTHLPFVTPTSDLDLLIEVTNKQHVFDLLLTLNKTKKTLLNSIGLKLDGELRIDDYHDISFNELIQCLNKNISTIVEKNLYTIKIRNINELLEWRPNEFESFRKKIS